MGNIGGRFATPIINHPEVAILGVNQIHDRPMVVDGEIVARKMMYLSPSFDHRVIDGAVAARFVTFVSFFRFSCPKPADPRAKKSRAIVLVENNKGQKVRRCVVISSDI